MLPLTLEAQLALSLSAVFILIALPLARAWRLACLAAALFVFWACLWRTGPTSGDHFGIFYVVTLVYLAVAALFAFSWSYVVEATSRRSILLGAIALLVLPVSISGWVLHSQWVPNRCLDDGLTVRIADTTLTLPFQNGRWFKLRVDGELHDTVYLEDKKHTAEVCRQLPKESPISVTDLRVGDRYNAIEFNLEPTSDMVPDWDWNTFERQRSFQSGTPEAGVDCYLRKGGTSAAFCAVWVPASPKLRAHAVNMPDPDIPLSESARKLRENLNHWLESVR